MGCFVLALDGVHAHHRPLVEMFDEDFLSFALFYAFSNSGEQKKEKYYSYLK